MPIRVANDIPDKNQLTEEGSCYKKQIRNYIIPFSPCNNLS